MRHDRIATAETYDRVDIAAVWPSGVQIAPLPVPDLEQPTQREPFMSAPAAPDVPAAVGRLIVGSYVALIAAFALATARTPDSVFMITISALFVAIYFTVPRLMLSQERHIDSRPTLDRFMAEGMETLTGHCTGRAALVQMLIVPVFLTIAVLVIGVAAAIIM